MGNTDIIRMPPRRFAADGRLRRIGVELEFSGLDLDHIVKIVRDVLGGEIEHLSDYEAEVRETELGTFRIELDFAYLKAVGRERAGEGGCSGDKGFDLTRLPQKALDALADLVVPYEVITAPVLIEQLEVIDGLVARLRKAGALGTRHSAVYAFGLHLNPEIPDLEAETLLGYLRAYLCLHDWLVCVGEVDLSRRLTPYINPFPKAYVRRVIAREYRPDLTAFMDDYLMDNADRNRALDLLPVLAEIDEKRVRSAVDDALVNPRPALHYRLPNCDIDVDGWGVRTAWGHWLEVERLAADPALLQRWCARYAEHLDGLLSSWLGDWGARSVTWLREGGP